LRWRAARHPATLRSVGVLDARVADGTFPVAHCGPCRRDVLTHLALDDDGEPRRRCVHCDSEIDPHELRWVEQIDALGYAVRDDAGCGRPDCGRGNCANRR